MYPFRRRPLRGDRNDCAERLTCHATKDPIRTNAGDPDPAAGDPARQRRGRASQRSRGVQRAADQRRLRGRTGWLDAIQRRGIRPDQRLQPAHRRLGSYLAGYNNADDQLRQSVSLPAGASSATLRLWWALETEEPALPNDSLTLSLLRSDGTTLADLWTVDNSAPAGLWGEAVIDLTGYTGQQVTIQLLAATNAYDLSDFYTDDLSLIVCTDSNAAQRSFLPLIVRS